MTTVSGDWQERAAPIRPAAWSATSRLCALTRRLVILAVLLLELAGGGSARACFVVGPLNSSPERAKALVGLALVAPFDEEDAPEGGTTSGGKGDEDRPRNEGAPWVDDLPRQHPAWHGLQTSSTAGASTASGPASGPGVSGLMFVLASGPALLGAERAEALFLVAKRFTPPPFASRLFRPPR